MEACKFSETFTVLLMFKVSGGITVVVCLLAAIPARFFSQFDEGWDKVFHVFVGMALGAFMAWSPNLFLIVDRCAP